MAPRTRLILIGVGGVLLLVGFFSLIQIADHIDPPQRSIAVSVDSALKQ